MIKLELLGGVVTFALWFFCLIDVIVSHEYKVRNLPKLAWLLIVLLFPLIGSIAWLVVGRPETSRAARSRWERTAPDFPEYDRPGRAAAVDPGKDEEFLKEVRARAEEQRRRHKASGKKDPEPDPQD